RRRQPDDGDAGDDRNVEFQPLRHDEDGGELAEHRKPAQPQDRIQADMSLRMAKLGSGNFSHIGQLGTAFSGHKHGGSHNPTGYTSCACRCNSRRTPSMTENDKASSRPTVADSTLSAAIEVDHLVKVYKQTRAVDDISFSLARGTITGLLGGNGAGKTTTIAMIMGLVLPTSGRVRVLG